jgi:hypothetical protein
LIEEPHLIFAGWQFIATRTSELHSKAFQEFLLFLKREHFDGGFAADSIWASVLMPVKDSTIIC